MDVLLQSSTHEGFGLPMLEAQSCGTPVVAVDATSMTELVAPGLGVLVAPLQKQLTTLESWVAVPDVAGLADGLRQQAAEPVKREELRAWATQYAWPTVAEHYWKPMLDQVAEELGAPGSADKPLKDALGHAHVISAELSDAYTGSWHRHDPSDPDAEPCCPECCDCETATEEELIVHDEAYLEGDRHGCCCQHVVEMFEATPGPMEETLVLAKAKWRDCPHHEVASELEVWIDSVRSEVGV
jgi:hypothetical protein